MITTRRSFLSTAAFAPLFAQVVRAGGRQAGGAERLLYVGTYTNGNAGSKGIYAWRFNPATGRVTSLGLAGETDSPSFLAVHPNKRFLYAVNELPPPEAGGPEGAVTAFSIDASSGKLTQTSRSKSGGRAPAHLTLDFAGKWVIVANYGTQPGNEGTSVAVFAIGADGKLAETPAALVPHVPKPKRLDPAAPAPKGGNPPVSHPHCVLLSPDNRFLFVAEKGFDENRELQIRCGHRRADAQHAAGVSRAGCPDRAPPHGLGQGREVSVRLSRTGAKRRDLRVRRGEGRADPGQQSVHAAGRCAADGLGGGDRSRIRTDGICTSRTAVITAWRCSRSISPTAR